ncbi:MAG: 3-oxoacyl-[acyl-carrier protein] reductase [Mycobacterium sp.]|nr:3-oxoacyl-[acyl-carrier protein] reductase [Mycobacterium sp.]
MNEDNPAVADFAGRRAVVTGGASGIGAAIADRLRRGGATVTVLDLHAVAGGIMVDLADRDAVEHAAEEIAARPGGVDVLVNCAGTFTPSPLRRLDMAVYDRILAVNLHAPVLLMRGLSEPMAAQGYGRIVNITSVHARVSEALSLAYAVSKGGLEAATRTASLELADDGVLVNAVAPGFVATNMSVVDGRNELEDEAFLETYVRRGRLPLRRAAASTEVAEAVAFLASDRNSYVTGQSLVIDGGLTVRF